MIKSYAIIFMAVIIAYLILDGIWLGLVARESYTNAMQGLMRENYIIWPWVVFYTMYSAIIVFLVIRPNINADGVMPVLLSGALLGIASYGAYNLTNYSIIKDWPMGISLKDWAWGAVVTTLSSLSGWYAAQLIK